jgi:hypothetical protein
VHARRRLALLAVAAAFAGGCGDDGKDAARTSAGHAESTSTGATGSDGKTGSGGSGTGTATTTATTHLPTNAAGIAKSTGGPAQVVEDYWSAARKGQSERFCSVLVIVSGGQPTELPLKACMEAFGNASAVKAAHVGSFERVLDTQVKGSRAVVRFRTRTKKGPRTEKLSVLRTPNGWKVLLKTR